MSIYQNNFIHNERGISDITKACSNLSCENTIDNLLNKKRNNSENNNFSSTYTIGFNNYNHLINHSYEPKKSIGIIKCQGKINGRMCCAVNYAFGMLKIALNGFLY